MKKYRLIPIALAFGLVLISCQAAPEISEIDPETSAIVKETPVEAENIAVLPIETAVPPTQPPPTEPSPTITPEPTIPLEPDSNRIPSTDLFTLFSEEPVIYHNDSAEVPMHLAFPGAVVYHDNLFHMFHNELEWWPAQVHTFYSTSPDGRNWTRVTNEPLFLGEALNAPYTAYVSSVLVEEDGTWVLYFYTIDNPVGWEAITEGSIGRATAPAPTGPWTADDKMVLTAGKQGTWDSLCVQNPSVVRTETEYVMYYTGYSERQAAIGMATSPDGIEWTKNEEPIFTRSGESGSWDNAFMIDPRVVLTPDGWVMLYSRSYKVGTHGPYGIAVSSDRINWKRSDEPVASGENVGPFIWAANLLYHDNTYFIYVQSGQVRGRGSDFSSSIESPEADWNIYLLTHEGSLWQ